MKNLEKVNIEGALRAEALRILRAIPGLAASARPPRRRRGADAVLRYAGSRTAVAVDFKRLVNAATAWGLVHRNRQAAQMPLLLVARETTAEARRILEEHGIGLADAHGNAHVEVPGLLFHREVPRPPRGAGTGPPPVRLQGKAGQVGQALLLHPDRAWHVAELAEATGVSAALAHRVLSRLEAEGVVAAHGSGPRRVRQVSDRTALLDLWAEECVERPVRTPAHILAQSPRQLLAALGQGLARAGVDYALTGAAAASLVAPFVSALPVVEVWVEAAAAPETLCEATGAEPVSDGENLVFLQAGNDGPLAFRERAGDLWIVNPIRLYAELRRDPRRGREQAVHLRNELLGL